MTTQSMLCSSGDSTMRHSGLKANTNVMSNSEKYITDENGHED